MALFSQKKYTSQKRCVDCGCTDKRACAGGCCWYSGRLCCRCVIKRAIKNKKPIPVTCDCAMRATAEGFNG